MHAMYIANYGSFLNWGYIHDDIINDLIVCLKNLEGMPSDNTTNTYIWCSYIATYVVLDIYKQFR